MPRPSNPHAYPVWVNALFQKLTQTDCPQEFSINAGTYKKAYAMRHTFYAYVRAKEVQASKSPLDERARILDDCAMVRRFMLKVEESAGIWVLKFQDRNIEPGAIDILAQVMNIGTREKPGDNSELPAGLTEEQIGQLEFVDPDKERTQDMAKLLDMLNHKKQ